MIEHDNAQLSIRKRCVLLNVNRSSLYKGRQAMKEEDEAIMSELVKLYEKYPFFGYRRMHAMLTAAGYKINRKKVQRLMQAKGLKAVCPKKKTSIKNKAHKVYPYLLRDMEIKSPNDAWGTDITYIRVNGGFAYVAGIIDIFSRKIVGWSLSPFMDTTLCLDAYETALANGKPLVLNSDQGSQYTGDAWIKRLIEDAIKVSMDGKGRWVDNVYIERFWRSLKYELIFLHSFESIAEARKAIEQYVHFYNQIRPHQALGYRTPNGVYYEDVADENRKEENVESYVNISTLQKFHKGVHLWS
ncbi:MAG: IS3 family transposase [Thermodesulfobacteriota bacterium]